MYTVVEIKGHQYKLAAGDLIDVEKIEAEVGSTVTFDKVLLVGGTKTIVGAPVVGGATVTAKVVKQGRTRKILVLKRKPGAYRRKKVTVSVSLVFLLQRSMMVRAELLKQKLKLRQRSNFKF